MVLEAEVVEVLACEASSSGFEFHLSPQIQGGAPLRG